MDPFVTIDAQKVLPNRFGLALAGAMRCRALRRGDEPRLALEGMTTQDLALHEIAAGAFTDAELAPFRIGQQPVGRLRAPHQQLGAGLPSRDTGTCVPPDRRTAH